MKLIKNYFAIDDYTSFFWCCIMSGILSGWFSSTIIQSDSESET